MEGHPSERFCDFLNHCLERAGATQKELADASGLSEATISRYCSGEREPNRNSKQMTQLAQGIGLLLTETEPTIPYEEIAAALNDSLQNGQEVDYDSFLENLNYLVKYLGIRVSELARGTYLDPSHLSRILSGSRRPGNVEHFIQEVAAYVVRRFTANGDVAPILQLIGEAPGQPASPSSVQEALTTWLGSKSAAKRDDSIPRFLAAMDEFDLNDYLKAVHFDELRLPPTLPQLPLRREYTGIQKMMESEIDFIKATVLSRSTEPCLLYSDMPLEEMAADAEFPKKYLMGMALLLKKGLHLNIIHDINRPFPEMMLGLESYIPMYMTGQISPYYLPASQGAVFSHLLKVSGAAALEGIAVSGKQADGKYTLYRSKEDVAHYRTRADELLAKARPLMDIYQKQDEERYSHLLESAWKAADCKLICSNLPPAFIAARALAALLDKAGCSADAREKIARHQARMRKAALALLDENRIHLALPHLDRAQYDAAPLRLSLADLFLEEEVPVPYSDYLAVLEELEELSQANPRFTYELNPSPTFHNINIAIIGDSLVIVSKEKHPATHFAIHHKKMIRAFKNFIPPLVEE